MLIMYIITLMLTLKFYFFSTPLIMASTIILQVFFISLPTYYLLNSCWYLLIIILIFVSGMMVLFAYISSLASNKLMFKLPFKTQMMMIFFLVLMCLFSPYLLKASFKLPLTLFKINLINLKVLYMAPASIFTILIMIYLFITLITVVKLAFFNNGPLKSLY